MAGPCFTPPSTYAFITFSYKLNNLLVAKKQLNECYSPAVAR